MKSLITNRLGSFSKTILIPTLSLLLAFMPLMAFKSFHNYIPKLKFKSMLFSKTNLDLYVNNADFDHFDFQCTNLNNTTPRHSYGLVVYVIDKYGKRMNNNIAILTDAAKQPTTGVNERDEHIYLASYKMTKTQYDAIVVGVTNFDALKFEAVSKTDGHGYANYVSYLVYPVDAQEKPAFKGVVKYTITDENYLNPSPPAPPM